MDLRELRRSQQAQAQGDDLGGPRRARPLEGHTLRIAAHLAKHLKDRSEDESFDDALGEMVRWRVALDAVNHLCRELLVMGILKKIDTAGSN